MSMMPYLPPTNADHYYYTNFSFAFNDPGSYWYLCSYYGHAANGMYGRILVVT